MTRCCSKSLLPVLLATTLLVGSGINTAASAKFGLGHFLHRGGGNEASDQKPADVARPAQSDGENSVEPPQASASSSLNASASAPGVDSLPLRPAINESGSCTTSSAETSNNAAGASAAGGVELRPALPMNRAAQKGTDSTSAKPASTKSRSDKNISLNNAKANGSKQQSNQKSRIFAQAKPNSAMLVPTTLTPKVATPVLGNAGTAVSGNAGTPVAGDRETPKPAVALAAPPAVPPLPSMIVIDNDDEKANAEVETFQWTAVPDQAGNTKLTTGIRFPVKVVSELNSKTCKVGDVVEGRTKVDIKIGGKLIASKGTRVVGHVFNVQPARKMLAAELSRKRWWRANGELGIQFDEMVTQAGEHLPLEAKPAKASLIVDNKGEGRVMSVNAKGEVSSPLSIQLKHQAVHLAIRGAASAGGVFSMGAVPVAYGVIGAINPNFAFMHPVGTNVPHRRLKGFGMGFISGVPGGFLIADSIIRGDEAIIKPGDEFLVEFKQDFTGEPAGPQPGPDAQTNVSGEIVKHNKSSDANKVEGGKK